MCPEPTTTTTAPVVFLSGAGLPEWVWDDVRALLPGRTAVARYPRGADVPLAGYADAVADQVGWARFAVVAHSVGGVVAAELMTRHPSRVSGILGVTAVVPRPGRSFVRSLPFPAGLVLGSMLGLVGTRPPARAIRTGLAQGLPEAVAERVVTDYEPESVRLYRDATSARDLPAARAYLHTTRDNEVTPATQRAGARVLDATWTEELATGHLPMLEDPVAVSRAVGRLLGATVH